MTGDDRKSVGAKGERTAEAYLAKEGYAILDKNFRCRAGEIDLVAEKHGTVVFVEVKTGRSMAFGDPAGWVGRRKQKKLLMVADYYIQTHNLHESRCRFDVIAIEDHESGPKIHHLQDAFWADEGGGWI